MTDGSHHATSVNAVGPRPLDELTGFKRTLLFAIAMLDGSNPSGQEVKSALERHCDEEVKHGRLYKNLSELVQEGFVQKRPIDGRTNAYRVTESALCRLKAHHRWEAECLPTGDQFDADCLPADDSAR